jgi:hypothetical protein
MTIDGMPDVHLHRICRRCQKWYFPEEGTDKAPEVTGPLGGMHAIRAAAGDQSMLRFECHRCSRVRRNTKAVLWLSLGGLVGLVLLLERLGVLR